MGAVLRKEYIVPSFNHVLATASSSAGSSHRKVTGQRFHVSPFKWSRAPPDKTFLLRE